MRRSSGVRAARVSGSRTPRGATQAAQASISFAPATALARLATVAARSSGSQDAAANADASGTASTTATRLLPANLRLMTLVFIAGVVSLAIEMCGPRLMAPYFGTSLYIWANQIGFTLIYLSIGYFVGGRLADRYPSTRLLCALTAAAALSTGLIPFVSRPVLEWSVSGLDSANASIFLSSLLAVILLFSVPTILLGMVSPFAIRLSVERVGTTGRRAGSLYALSTVGSILGAFLPVLLLIPAWGVRRTLFAACVVLLAASLWGLDLRWRVLAGLPAVALLVPLLLPQLAPLGALKPQRGLLYEHESLYNYIQVVNAGDGTTELVLNEGHAIHSVYNPNRLLTGWYWDYFLSAPYFNAAPANGHPPQLRRVAVIGLAAGTIARQFSTVYNAVPIDGVEIDPEIVSVGRRYFNMNEPGLQISVADGRTFMRLTHQTYDVIAIDAFQQPYIPFQLTTKEFFEELRAHLSPTGVICLNTGHTITDFRLVQGFVNTLRQVFPSVYTFNVPDTFNTEVMATMQPTSLATFQHNMQLLQRTAPGSVLGTVATEVLPVAQVARAEPGGVVFIDDRAPVEQLTDQLLLDYIQQGH